MQYQFDVDIATRYGVKEAIFVHNLYFWVLKNEANQKHARDGKTWTYNSNAALAKIFPFWTPRQISNIVDSCRSKGLIETDFLSENRRDRTLWYTITETVKCIYRNGEMHLPESSQPFHQTVECIKGTDSKPDSKPDIGRVFQDYAGEDADLAEELKSFVAMRKARRKKPTDRACEILVKKLDELSGGDRDLKIRIIRESIEHSWDSFYPPKDTPGKGRGEPTGEGYNLL